MPVIPPSTKPSVVENPQAIVGIMRFSLVLEDSNFFPMLQGQSWEERTSGIFDESRLKRRFEVFEEICLPSLAGQSDQGFNMLLATSQDLPDWAFARLENLVRDLPNIYVRAYRSGANIQRIYKRSAFEMLDSKAPVVATFRLDDDDALARDYVARVRGYLHPRNTGKTLTFAHGYQLSLAGRLQFRADTAINASAGLASIAQGGAQKVPQVKTIYCYGGHRHVNRLVPQIVDRTEGMYLQTANGFNVSERTGLGGVDVADHEVIETLCAQFPDLNSEILGRLVRPV